MTHRFSYIWQLKTCASIFQSGAGLKLWFFSDEFHANACVNDLLSWALPVSVLKPSFTQSHPNSGWKVKQIIQETKNGLLFYNSSSRKQ
jgi:hypothetical protein